MTKVYKNFIDGVPVAVIAEQMGLKYTTAIQRFRKYGTLEQRQHHLKGKDSCNLKILFEGRKLTEWAEHYSVTYTTIFNRYKKYGTVHPRQRKPKVEKVVVKNIITFEGKTLIEWAEHYGVSRALIYDRYKNKGTVHPKHIKNGRPKKNPSA